MLKLASEHLGDREFCRDYGVRLAYVAGAMAHGIASPELVCRMGRARLLSFLGTGGLGLDRIETMIRRIQAALKNEEPWGLNLLCNLDHPDVEEATVNLYQRYGVRMIEAAAFTQITRGLVLYRVHGLRRDTYGAPLIQNRVMAKISHPDVARQFLSPPPERIVKQLLAEGKITAEEAEIARAIPMADDLSVEADSGGHTDKGVAYSLVPAIIGLRDKISREMGYVKRIRVGAGGGLGTPHAIAASLILGVDFVLTGSINQATVEAGISDIAKDMLQQTGPRDTAMAPAGDMFELGAQVQVLSKGVLFPARANKLYDLYRTYSSLDEIDERTRVQIQDKFFHRSFEEVYEETRKRYEGKNPAELEKMASNPKYKMARIFRAYFAYSNRIAIQGLKEDRVNFQLCCGPALGSFNHWVAGTRLEDWRNRHVDEIAQKLMVETAEMLNQRYNTFSSLTNNI